MAAGEDGGDPGYDGSNTTGFVSPCAAFAKCYKSREEPTPRFRNKRLIGSDLGSLDELLHVVA